MAISYTAALYKTRVSTLVGSVFLGSWALACSLLILHASYDTDPVANSFAALLVQQGQLK